MDYTGPERRKNSRAEGRFIVSYRVLEEIDNVDVTQTKNFSLGGMLLTTNKQFPSGTHLALEIRLPSDLNPIMIIGKVEESRMITRDLIYDTRICFLVVDEEHKKIMSQTVDYYQKRSK